MLEPMTKNQIERMPTKAALAFGLSCAERMFPNYLGFTKVNEWGNPEAIRSALDLGWSSLMDLGVVDQEAIQAMRGSCEAAAPDTEKFSELASAALDSAGAAVLILDFLLESDRQRIVEVASLSLETIDMHLRQAFFEEHRSRIKSPEDMAAYSKEETKAVRAHFLYRREIRHQEDAIKLLAEGRRAHSFEELKSRWRMVPISSIGVAA